MTRDFRTRQRGRGQPTRWRSLSNLLRRRPPYITERCRTLGSHRQNDDSRANFALVFFSKNEMKCYAVLATLAVLSVCDGRRLFQRPPRFQVVPVNGDATGSADGSITSGISETPFGRQQIDSVVSNTGGTANGLGSSSVNTANADTSRTETLAGVSQTSDSDATSVQNTQGGVLVPTGGLFRRPSGHLFRPLRPLPIGGQASGNADGSVTVGVSEGVDGFSRVTSVSSSAGGRVSGGGSSVNTANASNSRTETIDGVSETSDTGAISVQNTRR